jgi:hypothetical protein
MQSQAKTGKKLVMGKSRVRCKKIDDVPLQVIGQAIKRMSTRKFIERYESVPKTPSTRRKTP